MVSELQRLAVAHARSLHDAYRPAAGAPAQADSLLLAEAAQIGARRMFIDALTPLLSVASDGPNGNGGSRETFHVLAQGLHRENLTAMMAVEVPGVERARLVAPPVEEFIADTIVLLRLEDRQRAVSRSIELVKSRGHEFEMGSHTSVSSTVAESKCTVAFRLLAIVNGSTRAPSTRTRAYRPASPASTTS